MSNEKGHRWMKPGMSLSRPHLVSDYDNAVGRSKLGVNVKGFIFIETDSRHETPTSDLAVWTKGPIEEIHFLRGLIQSTEGERMASVVLWAPILQQTPVFESWLALAETEARPELWRRVKGFRYLIQGMTDRQEFEEAVTSAAFVQNLQLLGRKGFVFDVGVDQHRGGAWQLDMMCVAIEQAHRGVTAEHKTVFVLNHLCKPDFQQNGQAFEQWSSSIERLSECSKTFMKLSGAFSELSNATAVDDVVKHIQPWFRHVLKCFGADRIMFGSDWPVCNANDLRIDNCWASWSEIISKLMDMEELSENNRERIWQATACEAYSLS